MKNPVNSLLVVCLILTAALLPGCGGGGGGVGDGYVGPASDWQGISGPLNFSGLATPTGGYSTGGWPVAAGATSFSVSNFTNASVAVVMLANYTAASQTITLSANQAAAGGSVRNSVYPAVRAFERTRVSDFYSGLRTLEDQNSRLPKGAISASTRASRRPATQPLPATYEFKVYSNGSYMPITGKLYKTQSLPVGTGKLHFYADESINLGASNNQGLTVTAYFDTIINEWNSIYLTMHSSFGSELQAGETPTGIDLGSDIYVLISPQLSHIDSLLAGFFYSGDLYPPERITGGISNELKIFYLNFRFQENALTSDIVSSTMAHEFQHMIFYSNRIKNGVTSDDAWLNESLSAYAESACGFRVNNGKNQSKAIQMQYYFNGMNQVPLVQNENWGSEAQYGQVALFGEWVAEKYGASGAVRGFYSSTKTGMAAVAEFTGKPFETIYAEWMLAMYLDLRNNLYGFNNLDWNVEYPFADLRAITLTGPIRTSGQYANRITDAALDASHITIAPLACFMIEFYGGGNGKSLDFVIQPDTAVTVFEFGR